ncbi:MAG: multiprotein-bridging factor 1 family protein [Natronomonas sp.]
MAKYSTGDAGGDSGGACELCGAEDHDLRTVTVAGAKLEVCSQCAHHGDEDETGADTDRAEERKRRKKAARNVARLDDSRKVDPNWEEGADYESDPLPYLVSSYGEVLENARQEAGLRPDELAAELDLPEDDVIAVEQGRAARAGVGGSVIEALENYLDVELAER